MDPGWFYLLLLLIPVAALSGWVAARRSVNNGESDSSIHPEYFKGLNYVLNEQPDKAIEVFVKMVEVDSETIETHLALGNLFRRRGEVDRAIRIHQNLIARPTLNQEQRSLALLELAMDYMRSGLLDRAEGLFKELIETGNYGPQAMQGLLQIYQQEKDWENAIITARRLESDSGVSRHAEIAQYYCEQAERHIALNQEKETREMIKRALNIDPNCARASIMEAEIAYREDRIKHAIKAYKRVEKQDPAYITEIIQPLYNCYRKLDKLDEYRSYLESLYHRHGGISPLLVLTQLIDEVSGETEAINFLSSELRKRPTVRGVDRLINYVINKAQGEIRNNLETIKELIDSLLLDRTHYKCILCGFEAKLMHWYCPSCKNWGSVKPIQGVEGE